MLAEDLASAEKNFNPLPPCGGRPSYISWSYSSSLISIHSLRVEGDIKKQYRGEIIYISIHSLRVEGDQRAQANGGAPRNFNPLPPCGGRQVPTTITFIVTLFQSTPSVWRETKQKQLYQDRQTISIHSLRVEGD